MSKDHPVWDVYDLQRTARLNIKYYSARIACLERGQFQMELVLAISAPSSAIAGLLFWESDWGQLAWKGLGILAAIFAVLKPLLKLADKIKKYDETLTGYKTLEHDLQIIASQIKTERQYSASLQQEFRKAQERKRALAQNEIEHKEDKILKKRVHKEVCEELPSTMFYIPLQG